MCDQHLVRIMANTLKVPAAAIGDDASTETILAWDSLRHINLVMAIEEEFGVEFGEQEIAIITSRRALSESLKEKLDSDGVP